MQQQLRIQCIAYIDIKDWETQSQAEERFAKIMKKVGIQTTSIHSTLAAKPMPCVKEKKK